MGKRRKYASEFKREAVPSTPQRRRTFVGPRLPASRLETRGLNRRNVSGLPRGFRAPDPTSLCGSAR